MAYALKLAQTARPLVFFLTDTADHIAGKAGLSPTVTLSKNGGAFASPAGAVTEIAVGWYKVAGNATDSGTVGPLILHATGSGADPTEVLYDVVAFDPEDAAGLGLSRLDQTVGSRLAPTTAGRTLDVSTDGDAEANVTKWLGTAAATPTVAGVPEVDVTHVGGDAQSATDLKDFADAGYDPGTNKVQGVVLTDEVTTYTGNTPQTGDSFARLGAPAGASVSADIAAVEAQTDDIGAAGAGLTAVPWNPAWDAEVESEATDALNAYDPPTKAELDSAVAPVQAKTDLIPAAPAAVGNIPTAAQIRTEIDANSVDLNAIIDALAAIPTTAAPTAAQNADALLDLADGVEVGLTLRGAIRLLAAAEAGKLSGGGTTTIVIRNAVADTKARITATVTAAGDRTAITWDPS